MGEQLEGSASLQTARKSARGLQKEHAKTTIRASAVSKRKRTAEEIITTTTTTTTTKRLRKTAFNDTISSNQKVIDLTEGPCTPRKKKSPQKQAPSGQERRERRFRSHAPQSFKERAARAVSQRMFVVGHSVTLVDGVLVMSFDIVGTTGNLYKTTIGKVPTCDCPDARRGNQCKHICYVLINVLKAPKDLQYQLAFLSSELRGIYNGSSLSKEHSTEDNGGNRKPVEGDCPICFMEFEPEKEDIVWCRAACGNNIHKSCFQQWAATQQSQGVRCVYCRSPWQPDTENVNVEELSRQGKVGRDGYLNVAHQFGLSGRRDVSSYHSFWVHRQRYQHEDDWDYDDY
ncbi:RING finger protein [Aspergillus homomorphus CBS 101889]|uniref:RING finger domain protein n=1 Tax=Aspergillus homomorphus (strain CBS 101889) TaxID=1450537 RepID=A0A395IBP1_ASPHC|nr:RING finger domain protein [Aspergillus homomorphus CBS 101889]RAL16508.1 RING finger domain protein [Aspergillus homomorphus CBS 101889]